MPCFAFLWFKTSLSAQLDRMKRVLFRFPSCLLHVGYPFIDAYEILLNLLFSLQMLYQRRLKREGNSACLKAGVLETFDKYLYAPLYLKEAWGYRIPGRPANLQQNQTSFENRSPNGRIGTQDKQCFGKWSKNCSYQYSITLNAKAFSQLKTPTHVSVLLNYRQTRLAFR